MRLLLIDAGNTRIKWRLHDNQDHISLPASAHGTVALAQLDELPPRWATLTMDAALIACVADEGVFARVQTALRQSAQAVPLRRLIPSRLAHGLVNAYVDPAQLGADRWAAAIGAAALHPGRVLVVASFGTATTIDLITPRTSQSGSMTERADFAGGVILPGIELMRASLARGTARLPLACGSFQDVADNTDDAIVSGILHAQAGAIERLSRRARQEASRFTPGLPALCLVGGGAASQILPLLQATDLGVTLVASEDLVLRGLACLSEELSS